MVVLARDHSPKRPLFPPFPSAVSQIHSGLSRGSLTGRVRAHTLERMTTDKIIFGTIAGIAAGIREKKFSPVEVVNTHLERVAELQPKLNAFVHLAADGARKQARAAEAAIARGERVGPLHGVPLTVKSCIDVAGWPTPAGSLMRKEYVPQRCALGGALARGGGDSFGQYEYAGIFDGV